MKIFYEIAIKYYHNGNLLIEQRDIKANRKPEKQYIETSLYNCEINYCDTEAEASEIAKSVKWK